VHPRSEPSSRAGASRASPPSNRSPRIVLCEVADLTVVGHLLLEVGVSAVFPFALATAMSD
jgi:hypothetical protein